MPSPTSTGGAGVHFESKVAAYYLAQILTHSYSKGLSEASALRVRLQRAFEKQPLDDVIIDGRGAAGEKHLPTQVKRKLTIGANALFKEVMDECWRTFTHDDFSIGNDRLGVAVGNISTTSLECVPKIVQWARDSADSEDYFHRLKTDGLSSSSMRSIVDHIKSAVEESANRQLTDEELWQFLAHFELLYFDFDKNDSSESLQNSYDRLKLALHPSEESRVVDLWNALVEIIDTAKSSAGSIDRPLLVERLHGRFKLAGLQYLKADKERVRTNSTRAIAGIQDTLGGLKLSRTALLDSIRSHLPDNSFIEIIGEKGCGKSALLKSFADTLPNDSSVITIDALRFSYETIERQWGLENPFRELVNDLSADSAPYLLIDGVDRLSDPGVWAALNEVIREVRGAVSGERWTIVVTARGNNLTYIENIDPSALKNGKASVSIGHLEDELLDLVVEKHPQLEALIKVNERAKNLAKNPYLLERLLRSQTLTNTDSNTPLTEIDLMLEMWKSDGGVGGAMRMRRQSILRELALQRISEPGRPLSALGTSDAEAIQSLVDDDVISVDEISTTIRFQHDVLEDWTFCQVLFQERKEIGKWLIKNDQPLWLGDAIQLLAQWLLEKQETIDEWGSLIESVTNEKLETRWRRAVLTAPLQSSGRATELLQKVEGVLLENDAVLLKELMVALRTVEVFPNSLWYSTELYPDVADTYRKTLAYSTARPRGLTWFPFLLWLRTNLVLLPPHLTNETSHLLGTYASAWHSLPDFISEAAADWAMDWLHVLKNGWGFKSEPALAERYKSLNVKYDEGGELTNRLRQILYCCAKYAPEKVIEYMGNTELMSDDRAIEHVLKHSNTLAAYIPTELVDFILTKLVHDTDEAVKQSLDDMMFDEYGMKHQLGFQTASHISPPFLALLKLAPKEGLRLVNGLCNKTIEVWKRLQPLRRQGTPLPIRISFDWGESQFWGRINQYMWFRGEGMGPHLVQSALMALELWMEEQVNNGKDIGELFQIVLEDNEHVAALGACVSIACQFKDKSLEAAIPLVACPQIWGWDYQRMIQDHSPSNTIGIDATLLKPVVERNEMPHRRMEVRQLVGYYVMDARLREAYGNKILEVASGELPFFTAEERQNESSRLSRMETIDQMIAWADPENYELRKAEHEGSEVAIIQYVPPSDLAPEVEKSNQELEKQNNYSRLIMWAENSAKQGSMESNLATADALAMAKKIYDKKLFVTCPTVDEYESRQAVGAVAAAVSVILQYDDEASDETIRWCREVALKAASLDTSNDPHLTAGSSLTMHPVVYGVRGMLGLLKRGILTKSEREKILELVCHPLKGILAELFIGLGKHWEKDEALCWLAVVLSVRISVVPQKVFSRGYGGKKGDEERKFIKKEYKDVLALLASNETSGLREIPMPWIEDETIETPDPQTGNYSKSEQLFDWSLPPKTIFEIPVDAIMQSSSHRHEILQLMVGYINWTICDCQPPWSTEKPNCRAFEWQQSLMAWCAKLTAHMEPDEVEALIISPICIIGEQNDAHLLSDFIKFFMLNRFSQNEGVDKNVVSTWSLLNQKVRGHKKTSWAVQEDFLDIHFGPCVNSTLFAFGGVCLFEHPWPALGAVTSDVELWVDRFKGASACFAILADFLKKAGSPLINTHGIEWLQNITKEQHKNSTYWSNYNNGTEAVELVDRFIADNKTKIISDTTLQHSLSNMLDILISNGVRRANYTQQSLTRLSKLQ